MRLPDPGACHEEVCATNANANADGGHRGGNRRLARHGLRPASRTANGRRARRWQFFSTLGIDGSLSTITIDYPEAGSIFPPEIIAPTFFWHDADKDAKAWLIDVAFADGTAAVHAESQGQRLQIGEIDARCIAETNEPPKLTPEQATAWAWTPDAKTWETIKKHSVASPATVVITGCRDGKPAQPVSRGQVALRTSQDPVGAADFYRDVPLAPSRVEKGVIQPLPANKLNLIAWRLRDIGRPESRLLLDDMPTCANCHSFSRDGGTLGMDLDGPDNDKGLYLTKSVAPRMSIRNADVFQWNLPVSAAEP